MSTHHVPGTHCSRHWRYESEWDKSFYTLEPCILTEETQNKQINTHTHTMSGFDKNEKENTAGQEDSEKELGRECWFSLKS